MAELTFSIGGTTGTRTGADESVGPIATHFLYQHYVDEETTVDDIDALSNQEKIDKVLGKVLEFIMESHRAWLVREAEDAAAEAAEELAEEWT